MFAKSAKIYQVYEKPEAAEPADRVVLLREGFSFWAFLLQLVWVLTNRMWLVAAGFFATMVAVQVAGQALHLSVLSLEMLQLLLQFLLGYHAYDLQGWCLTRKGYRRGGILVAESESAAEQRYYEHAA